MLLPIGSCAALAEGVDYANLKEFVIDPSQIPLEKIDITLHAAVSVRDLTKPCIATIAEGMEMFCEYLVIGVDAYWQDVVFGLFVLAMIILSIDRSKASRGIAVK